MKAAGIEDDDKGSLFRSAKGKTGTLSRKAMAQPDVWRMIRRRAKKAGIKTRIGCTASGRRGSPTTWTAAVRWRRPRRWPITSRRGR
jgi:hypothetical protein